MPRKTQHSKFSFRPLDEIISCVCHTALIVPNRLRKDDFSNSEA